MPKKPDADSNSVCATAPESAPEPTKDASASSAASLTAIVGCGWLGLAVAQRLAQMKIAVIGTTTTPARLQVLRASGIDAVLLRLETGTDGEMSASEATEPYSGSARNEDSRPALKTESLTRLFGCKRLLVTIPPVGFDSAPEYRMILAGLLARWDLDALEHLVFISSTSVYGAAKGALDEGAEARPVTTSALILADAENYLRELCGQAGLHVSVLRSAGQIGFGRHPGRFFAGKTAVPDPQLPVNMVHQIDLAECAAQLLLRPIQGASEFEIYNAASATHPHREDFYSEAAIHLGLPPPRFVPQDPTNRPGRTIVSQKIREHLGVKFRYDDLMAFIRGKLP